MEPYQTEQREQHLFDESLFHLVQASGGKRFLNYLIDRVVFYFFTIAFNFVLTIFELYVIIDSTAGRVLFSFFTASLLYAGFMGFIEFVLKGKTIGKFFTGTRAVKQDSNPLSLSDAMLRGLCRIIPFNAFSALGTPAYPWHDRLSKTYVIDERQSRIYIE